MTEKPIQKIFLLTKVEHSVLVNHLDGRGFSAYIRRLISEDMRKHGKTFPNDISKPGRKPQN